MDEPLLEQRARPSRMPTAHLQTFKGPTCPRPRSPCTFASHDQDLRDSQARLDREHEDFKIKSTNQNQYTHTRTHAPRTHNEICTSSVGRQNANSYVIYFYSMGSFRGRVV